MGVWRRALAAADQLDGLVAVETGHGDVHQDQRELLPQHRLQRLGPGIRAHERVPGVLEDRLERQQVLRMVVDEEDADAAHGVPASRRGQGAEHPAELLQLAARGSPASPPSRRWA